MVTFLFRFATSALALWLAAQVVPGIVVASVGSLLAAALLLGLVNAVVRPIAIVLTLPLTLLTLGLFLLVINAAMLGLVGALLNGFEVQGFWAALMGSLVVSAVSWVGARFIGRR